jgi:LysM repeat protein
MKHTSIAIAVGATLLAAPELFTPSQALAQIVQTASLQVNAPACVVTTRLNVRQSPGYLGKAAGDVVAELPQGTVVTIAQGPTLRDRSAWWAVTVAGVIRGWAAEWSTSGARLLARGICPPTTAAPPPLASYTVAVGDTLGGLAERFGTTVVDIMRANHLADASLAAGQFLWIPPATAITPPQMRLLGDVQWLDLETSQVQVLQAGRSVWAVWTNGASIEHPSGVRTTVAALVPGTTIEVIGSYSAFGGLMAARIYIVHEPTTRPAEALYWPYQQGPSGVPAPARVHVVQPGETLYGLAARYRTTIYAIQQANGMSPQNTAIRVYDRLLIP